MCIHSETICGNVYVYCICSATPIVIMHKYDSCEIQFEKKTQFTFVTTFFNLDQKAFVRVILLLTRNDRDGYNDF